MPRLRHSITGVVISVSDEKAGRLVGFVPVEAGQQDKPKPARRAAKATDSDDK